jgi:hypothetical protein
LGGGGWRVAGGGWRVRNVWKAYRSSLSSDVIYILLSVLYVHTVPPVYIQYSIIHFTVHYICTKVHIRCILSTYT